MISKKKLGFFIFLMCISFSSSSALAADGDYRLMHNDHDALIIGEITKITEDEMLVQVEKQIINLTGWMKKQATISDTIVIDRINYYRFYDGSEEGRPNKGDYILASLDKTPGGFKDAWGIYKVDSKDYKILSVIIPKETASSYLNLTSTAINRFINSDGKDSEFSYDGNKLYLGEELIYEYKGEIVDKKVTSTGDKELNTINTYTGMNLNDKENLSNKNTLAYIFAGALIIILCAFVYKVLSSRRYKK